MDCSPRGSSVHGESPDENNRVGSHSLFQGIFLTQRSNPGLLQSRQILYHLSHPRSPLCIGGQPVNNVVTVSGEQWRDSAKGPSPNTVTFKYWRVRGRWLELQHMYFEGDRIHSWQKTSSCPCHIASELSSACCIALWNDYLHGPVFIQTCFRIFLLLTSWMNRSSYLTTISLKFPTVKEIMIIPASYTCWEY